MCLDSVVGWKGYPFYGGNRECAERTDAKASCEKVQGLNAGGKGKVNKHWTYPIVFRLHFMP